MGKVTISDKTFKNFGKCIEISNGIIDLLVTTELGPRIIRYGFKDQPNEFCDDAPLTLDMGNEEWKLYGGHRLWHSPEVYPRTYVPDNEPVRWERITDGIRVVSDAQLPNMIEKEMEITISSTGTNVRIVHKLTNKNAWAVEFAAWALSVMAPGGIEIIPVPQHASHFSDGAKGSRIITLWSYAKMNDPRICWGNKYITVRQDQGNKDGCKFGISNEDGWAAYLNKNHMFVKKYTHLGNSKYPDNGVSYETYFCDFMLEMESLSPLATVEPGETIIHTEEWTLTDGVTLASSDEREMDEIVEKYIKML